VAYLNHILVPSLSVLVVVQDIVQNVRVYIVKFGADTDDLNGGVVHLLKTDNEQFKIVKQGGGGEINTFLVQTLRLNSLAEWPSTNPSSLWHSARKALKSAVVGTSQTPTSDSS